MNAVSAKDKNADRAEEQRPEIPADRLEAVFERGLQRCREGNFKEGLVDLAWLANNRPKKAVPSLCYSYLGYGLARYRGQARNGLRLCKHAVKLEFYQPENYVNLARTALLADQSRHEAAEAVYEGLKIDPGHPELRELQRELGIRRPPVLGFLSRRNLLNQVLGWFRHQLTSAGRRKKPAS